ncbi:hypothetical protein SZ64_17985 [Erythrobacter sp. SG61-1L]|uniref:DUF805 domain-containing protein n=1 Tax=Erythrobacter sp. SG61-1L TaxID=1603897 RepID=UPI0006C9270E|nr:DUF805 domain-containing protein [Erythrobacter sp. SG61-1L]KPL69725.1 hypothetical protein SZ64_17460 [Erythrobacter sp. SG61-1L]KPL69822.1 hypothetical protein SZ64_17985 [Erythrobacter sp. SG61-1L]
MNWMFLPFKRYFDFSGRSRRKEFWMFTLLNVILACVLAGPFYVQMFSAIFTSAQMAGQGVEYDESVMAASMLSSPVLIAMVGIYGIYALFALIPSIAVTVRRLHDRNMSGWWYLGFILLSLIPFVGFLVTIAFLVILCLDGTAGPNRFGPDPKGRTDVGVFA